ncbi:hypothetical protein BFW01_g3039 [Lasiodiplodia theobromae]|nr:hypothetical protein BFW01_g3039 [Lasiodiplodia theobromae]
MMTQTPETTRPLGPVVEPRPVTRPEHRTFQGKHVTLRPLAPSDADALFPLISGPENAWLFDYLPYGPFPSSPDGQDLFRTQVANQCASKDPLFFAILVNDRVLGWSAFMRIDAANGVVEVGHLLFATPLQRTPAATETIYLLAQYAFEDLRYRRLEWKANNLNEASKRAAARLGFVWEGLFRAHLIVRGRRRDTVWFSMVEADWFGEEGKGAAREALSLWLDGANFDGEGKQRRRLEDIRRELVNGAEA